MINTWLISDTHFGHDSMIKYENRPVDHNEIMVNNWNKIVKDEDLVIHCGDLFFGKGVQYVKQLKGNIVLVRGNHDKKSINWYMNNGIKFVCDEFTLNAYGKKMIFSHKPITTLHEKYDLNIHGHFHSITHHDMSSIPNYESDDRYSLFTIEAEDYTPIKLKKFVERDFRRIPKERKDA